MVCSEVLEARHRVKQGVPCLEGLVGEVALDRVVHGPLHHPPGARVGGAGAGREGCMKPI